ncbi:kinase-like protein [Rhizophagus irregularis]|uniref:Kinase-like protein n=1 Tax=Rhizophagus irregularis TaxID=588596 RepID=A0A2I1GS08_9GLOM|nr:kinase-like protein [Rhizophagus irregularis]
MVLNERPPTYGNCLDCKTQRTTISWCKNCEIAFLKENFPNWTSGSSIIDEFIRYTQLNATKSMDYLEWIDFDKFDLVKNINKRGTFSSIYSAIWLEGPRWNLDEEAEVWTRNGPIKVILKRLDNSQYMSQEFVNQLYRYHKCLQNGALADCFGITKDPTSNYMFVMRYYENGDLYSYLEESMEVLCWRDIVDILWSISTGLESIHEHGLVHGHLHGGNILIESEMNSVDAKIADTGLHGPVDKQVSSEQIYGVIPFVAPEVLDGSAISKESDIYSFGMIMWMLSAGIRPHNDRPHDKQLIQEICSGLRPNEINGTPPVFSRLMLQCLDANPLNRPTASQICECLGNWVTAICDSTDPSELLKQFDTAEDIKFANLENCIHNNVPSHEKAIYISRPLNSINMESPVLGEI